MDPILAYSETGSFPSVDEWDLPYGLTLWMHAQEDLASFYRENNMEQDPAAKYAWDKLMGIETVSTKAVDPVKPCEEGDEGHKYNGWYSYSFVTVEGNKYYPDTYISVHP